MADEPDKRARPDDGDQDIDRDVEEEETAAAAPDSSSDEPDDPTGADGEPEDELHTAAEAVETDIEELAAARDEYLNAYRRVQADFENFRKQTQKRLDANVASQLGGFVERLLPVLDACDAAARQGANEAVEPIVTTLYGALEKEGLERIDPKGDVFDPEVAEAVQHLPGEGGDQVVAEVVRTGYRWKGRVLRPALVKVTD